VLRDIHYQLDRVDGVSLETPPNCGIIVDPTAPPRGRQGPSTPSAAVVNFHMDGLASFAPIFSKLADALTAGTSSSHRHHTPSPQRLSKRICLSDSPPQVNDEVFAQFFEYLHSRVPWDVDETTLREMGARPNVAAKIVARDPTGFMEKLNWNAGQLEEFVERAERFMLKLAASRNSTA